MTLLMKLHRSWNTITCLQWKTSFPISNNGTFMKKIKMASSTYVRILKIRFTNLLLYIPIYSNQQKMKGMKDYTLPFITIIIQTPTYGVLRETILSTCTTYTTNTITPLRNFIMTPFFQE